MVIRGKEWLSVDTLMTVDVQGHFRSASTYNFTSSSKLNLESNLWDTTIATHDKYSLFVNGSSKTLKADIDSHSKSKRVKQNDVVYGAGNEDDNAFDYGTLVANQAGAVTSACFSFFAAIAFLGIFSYGNKCVFALRPAELAIGVVYVSVGVLQIVASAVFEDQATLKVEALEHRLKQEGRNFSKVETLGNNANVTAALDEAFTATFAEEVCGATCKLQLYLGISSVCLGAAIAALAVRAMRNEGYCSLLRGAWENEYRGKTHHELSTASNPVMSDML